MENKIRNKLIGLSDEKYRQFTSLLIPGEDNILGVRLPVLRGLAKEIAKGDWQSYLKTADSFYLEEVMLQGMVIGYAKGDIEEILKYASCFIPKIRNWSICDSFCSTLKITRKNMGSVWNFLQPYIASEKEYYARFGVVMILDYFINPDYISRIFLLFDAVKSGGYYVKMAVAWAVSACFVKLPNETMPYLKNNSLDDFTYNKSLQKITESFNVDVKTKELIRSMKRK